MSENSTPTCQTPAPADESHELDGWLSGRPDDLRSVRLLITELRLTDSPRSGGPDEEHVRMLAESADQLPPIVVHSASMLVVDGEHRVRAAMLRGQESIDALLYHGSPADAFVLSVRMNIAHGLPLSRADRTRAAGRIIASHPQWSNRMIASATGLAPATVAEVRRRSTGQTDQLATRIGKDGRLRPVSGASGRERVRELLLAKPDASLRAIAREAGVSPSTACDVRQRLRAGQAAVPAEPDRPAADDGGRPNGNADVVGILALLMKDPNLRFSDAGRALLRWLNGHRAGMAEQERIAPMVPDHCVGTVAQLARGYASAWGRFASQLEERDPNRSK